MIPHKQLSLAEIFSDCQKTFENDKPQFLSLLENTININKFIPSSFIHNFYASTGRPRKYPLNAMILSSIAMEELALSHIINAESKKLEYVLKKNSCLEHCVILEINKIEYIPICVKPCSTLCNDTCSTNCNYNEECKLKYKEICNDCVKSLLEKKINV